MSSDLSSLPHNLDAEKAILSALIQYPDRVYDAQKDFQDEHFYSPATRLLFQSIKQMVLENVPLELPALTGFLMDRGLCDKCGGPGELAELYSFLPTGAHYGYYRDILHQKAKQRAVILALEASLSEVKAIGDSEVETAISSAAERLYAASRDNREDAASFKEKLMQYMDTWEARFRGEVETGIPTRWRRWNQLMGGITPRMWVACAYPGVGKSTLAQNLVEDVCAHGHDALWYIYEMDETEVMDRLVCARSAIESQKVFFPKDNPLTREEQKRVFDAIRDIQGWGLHLRCKPTWTIEQIVADVRAMKRKNPKLKLVVADYLQLIPTKKDFGTKRADQVAYISRMFKREVSAANGIAALMLSQLNDDGKVLDSRAATQDASNIIFIEDEKEVERDRKKVMRPASVYVAKNRNGKAGVRMNLRLNGSTFTFEEYSPEVVRQ